MIMDSDDDFETLKQKYREIAGDDNEYFLDLLEAEVAEGVVSYYMSKIYEVDESPSVPDFGHIPKKKRGSNATKQPADHEQYTKTDALFNMQPSQSDIENSRKEAFGRDDDDNDHDYIPADCENEEKKPVGIERAKRNKGKRKLVESDEEERRVKKKRSIPKKIDLAKLGLEPPPGLSQQLQEFIQQKGGADVKLVLMKNLYKTDLEKRHDRFSLPVSQIRDTTFLNESDEEKLIGKKQSISVNVALSEGLEVAETTGMKLRYWHSNSQFALTSSWMGVVGSNRDMLTVNSIMQVWSFRVDDELWLILVKIRDAVVDDDDAKVESSEGKEDDDDDVNERKDDNGASSSTSFGHFGVNMVAA